MDDKEMWPISDIIDNRNNWSLAGDAELLKYLHHLSKKLFCKSQSTLNLLKSFEDDVNQTCIRISNIANHFGALSDTQFIESKVEDSPEIKIETSTADNKKVENSKHEDITVKLKEALNNGMNVLDTNYDIIAVTDSDSESEEPQEVLLKVRNPYMSRRLPYIIGSDDFTNYDHLGLVNTSSSDEEEEEEEEDESEEEIVKQPLPNVQPSKPEASQTTNKTHVLRVSSSDSEDSDISFSQKEYDKYNEDNKPNQQKSTVNVKKLPTESPAEMPYSFAEHLNATLQNYGVSRYEDIGSHADIFSPPPFPTRETNYSSSDDEKSDSSNDILDSKQNIKKSVTDHSIVKSEIVDNSDNNLNSVPPSSDTDLFSKESLSTTATIPKTSRFSKVAVPNKPSALHKNSDESTTLLFAQNDKNKTIISAVNAELASKLQFKQQPESNEEESEDDLTFKSAVSSPPASSVNNSMLLDETSKITNVMKDEQNTFDTGTPKKLDARKGEATQSPNNFYSNLFDDDDDELDEFFKSTVSTTESENFETCKHNSSDYELEPEPNFEKVKHIGLPGRVSSVFGRKLALFDSDSESEDEILAIINSQKKKTSDTDPKNCMKERSSAECSSTREKKEPAIVAEQSQILVDNKNVESVVDFKSDTETCEMVTDTIDKAVSREIGDSVIDSETGNYSINEHSALISNDAVETESLVTDNKFVDFKPLKIIQDETFIDSAESVSSSRDVLINEVSEMPLTEESTTMQREFQNFANNKNSDILPSTENVFDETNSLGQFIDKRDRNVLFKDINNLAKSPIKERNLFENINTTTKEIPTLLKPKPGKLTPGRGLNINVNALLPGSKWSTVSMQQKEGVAAKSEEVENDHSVEVSPPNLVNETQAVFDEVSAPSVSRLSNVIKERIKISKKRRPPSRRVRISNVINDYASSEDDIDGQNEAEKFAEPPKTLNSTTEQISQSSKDVEKLGTEVSRSLSENETLDDIFLRKNVKKVPDVPATVDLKNSQIEATLSNNTSASVLTGFIKDRAKLPKRRPPTRRPLQNTEVIVAESILQEDIQTNIPHSSDALIKEPSGKESTKVSSSINEHIFETEKPKRPRSPRSEKIKKLFDESDDDDVDLIADLLASSKKNSETSTKVSVFSDFDDVEEVTLKSERVSKSTFKEPESTNFFEKSFSGKSNEAALFSSEKTYENSFDDFLTPSPVTKNIFDKCNLFDDNDGDIFTKSVPKAETSNSISQLPIGNETKSPSKTKVSKSSSKLLFDKNKLEAAIQPEIDVLDKSNKNNGSNVSAQKEFTKAKNTNEPKKKDIDLFGDENDELFGKSIKSLPKSIISTKSSLFDDDDDDDLFGKKSSINVGISSDNLKKPKSVSNVEKGRVVKLRSEAVIKDPLTGK